jgi:hypothetical protein
MSDDEFNSIKDKVDKAMNITAHIEDNKLRIEAFKIVLERVLDNRVNSDKIPTMSNETRPDQTNGQGFFELISEKVGVTPKSLNDLFAYDDTTKKISFRFLFDDRKVSKNQMDAVLMYMTMRLLGMNQSIAEASEIRDLIVDSHIELKHIADTLKGSKGYFKATGNGKSGNYEITPLGWKRGIELIQEKVAKLGL